MFPHLWNTERVVNESLFQRYARHEAQIREMLGRWVSELEPIAVYGPDHELVGLAQANTPLGVKLDITIRPKG